MLWLEFILCAVLIIAAATVLSRYADVLAEKTGLGRAWIGGILLAGVTSLPELASGVSAVTLFDAPNLAVGSVLGSSSPASSSGAWPKCLSARPRPTSTRRSRAGARGWCLS